MTCQPGRVWTQFWLSIGLHHKWLLMLACTLQPAKTFFAFGWIVVVTLVLVKFWVDCIWSEHGDFFELS